MSALNVLLLDNFDSFAFNLYQMVGELLERRKDGSNIKVIRNNEWDLAQVKQFNPSHIIIGPGPGSPDKPAYFGICGELIKELGPTIPTLGVCLGMQGLCHIFGATITHAKVPMHGKISSIVHNDANIFHSLPQNVEIMRYHSLVVDPKTIAECLEITSLVALSETPAIDLNSAIQEPHEIMGVKHKEFPIQGIQFHPESFGTEGGYRMLANFIEGK
jgi:anthranilate synthase component 2